MRVWHRGIAVLFLAVVGLTGLAAYGQTAKPAAKEPSTARIALYRVAPGKQLDFLKWAAEVEAIDKEAGVPASQIYAHTNGDSWDYMQIAPDLSKEQQAKVDEVTKKHGRKTGFAASLEFRALVSSHTDTFVVGPVSAADLVASAK
jgi:uncharacterized iron-regulated membrane protein